MRFLPGIPFKTNQPCLWFLIPYETYLINNEINGLVVIQINATQWTLPTNCDKQILTRQQKAIGRIRMDETAGLQGGSRLNWSKLGIAICFLASAIILLNSLLGSQSPKLGTSEKTQTDAATVRPDL
mgnify:CR=1 FL=1